jgi:hypothetical protein
MAPSLLNQLASLGTFLWRSILKKILGDDQRASCSPKMRREGLQ